MEKSRSFPNYSSSSYCYRLGFEDGSKSYNFNGPSGDGFSTSVDPDVKRKKRIASYNGYTTESKFKTFVMNSFKWVKNKLNEIRY